MQPADSEPRLQRCKSPRRQGPPLLHVGLREEAGIVCSTLLERTKRFPGAGDILSPVGMTVRGLFIRLSTWLDGALSGPHKMFCQNNLIDFRDTHFYTTPIPKQGPDKAQFRPALFLAGGVVQKGVSSNSYSEPAFH